MQLLLMFIIVEMMAIFMNIFDEFLYFYEKHCWASNKK